jgi:hypothetical protein
MDRRTSELKQRKRQLKNEIKRSDKKLYKLLVGFSIFGILNWLFWYNQYLNEGILCDITFIYLPMLLGMIFFYFKFNSFVKYYSDTTSILDKIGCFLLLLLMGIMISFLSFGTVSDIIYKSLMDYSIKDKSTEIQFYSIDRFIYGSGRRNSINRFSRIEYHDATMQNGNFSLSKFNGDDSAVIGELKNLDHNEIKKKKLVLYTKEGFGGIKKIINYKIN